MPKLFTLTQAAAELGVTADNLRHQVHNGRLRAELLGKQYVITDRELERYRRESLGNVGRPRIVSVDTGKPRITAVTDGKPVIVSVSSGAPRIVEVTSQD